MATERRLRLVCRLAALLMLAAFAWHLAEALRPAGPDASRLPEMAEPDAWPEGGGALAGLAKGRLVRLEEITAADLAALPGFGDKSARKTLERGFLGEGERKRLEGYLYYDREKNGGQENEAGGGE